MIKILTFSIYIIVSLTTSQANEFTCKKVHLNGLPKLFCPHTNHFYKQLGKDDNPDISIGENSDQIGEWICKRVNISGQVRVFCPNTNSFYQEIHQNEFAEIKIYDNSREFEKEIESPSNSDQNSFPSGVTR